MSYRRVWRKSVNGLMLGLTGLCALVTVSVLFFILGYLVWHGGRYSTAALRRRSRGFSLHCLPDGQHPFTEEADPARCPGAS